MTARHVTELLERQLEVASLTGEVDTVMQAVVDRLMRLDGVDGASISMADGEMWEFTVTAGEDAPLQGLRLPIAETLGHQCIGRQEPVVLRRTGTSGIERGLTPGAASIVLTPLVFDGRTAGVMGARSPHANAFQEHELDAFRLLALSASIALRNAEMVGKLRESERAYRVMHDHAADPVLVVDADGSILDANSASATLLGYSRSELGAMHTTELLPAGETALRQAELAARGELRGERTLVRKDAGRVDVEYALRRLEDGRVHTTLRDVTDRKRADERLRGNLERLRAIVETQREISSLELDPDAVTRAIVERAQHLTQGDGAVVQWFEGDETVYRFASGMAEPFVGLRFSRHDSLTGVATRGRTVAYAPDTFTDDRVARAATDRVGLRSLVCAPLFRGDDVEGVLSVMSAEPHAFDELAIETTRLMAEFVSTVFRNTDELVTKTQLVDRLRAQSRVVEQMRTALWVWRLGDDDVFVLESGNEASAQATGLRLDDVLGRTAHEVLPAAGDDLIQLFRHVVEEGVELDSAELAYTDERMGSRVFALRAFPLGERRVAVTFENVTEITRAREAIELSEARFRGAFASANVGMVLISLDGRYSEANERFAAMLGCTPDELAECGFEDFTHPDELEIDRAHLQALVEGRVTSVEREKRYVRKDGSVMWGDLSVSVIAARDGLPTHAFAHVQDITEQKEANLLFEATFARSVVPAIIADDERRIVDLNDAAAQLIGVDRSDAPELRIDDLLAGEPVGDLWHAFVESGRLEAEVTLLRPDGGKRRIEFVATANVRPDRHIAVIRDLTRQKELESQLRQAQKMEAVGRLAGGIAHDFNNLLTAIAGYSEFLATEITDERMNRHADEIRKAAARAASLTGQLLAFSRRQVLQPRVLDLNAVVVDMDSLLRRLIGEDVELIPLLHPEPAWVRADPTQIEQVIVNLTVNARDAMPSGGSVTIETASIELDTGSFVELRLTDTGFGMTEEERAHLFDPFFTTKEGGTGLGLATVHGIVEQSGGTIEVDSSPGLGSSFRVLLPGVESPQAVEPPAARATAAAVGNETILLVEDESIVRQLVGEILESNGYTVLQAADGPSALELLRRHPGPVELLLTDVVMPGMSGPEVAHAVTAMRPGIPVLYTSGYTDSAIDHHGVLEDGIAFLQKPFSADDLTRKIRALLDEPARIVAV